MVWNGLCAIKEHSKVIFCWLHFFSPMKYGGRNIQKFQKFFRKYFKVFQSPKMVWNGFCAMKEHSKVIFVDFILFNQVEPNNSVSETVWNKSKSSQKQFLLTILLQMYSTMWKTCLYFFIYMCNYVCFHQNKSVYLLACVQKCNFYLLMNIWKKGKDEKFMYKILRIHVYNNESIYESVYLFKKKYNCA